MNKDGKPKLGVKIYDHETLVFEVCFIIIFYAFHKLTIIVKTELSTR